MIAAFVKKVGGNVGLGNGEMRDYKTETLLPRTRLSLRYKLNRTSAGAFRRLEPSSCDLSDDNHHITISMRELAG